jgi:hypothetical protein
MGEKLYMRDIYEGENSWKDPCEQQGKLSLLLPLQLALSIENSWKAPWERQGKSSLLLPLQLALSIENSWKGPWERQGKSSLLLPLQLALSIQLFIYKLVFIYENFLFEKFGTAVLSSFEVEFRLRKRKISTEDLYQCVHSKSSTVCIFGPRYMWEK